MAERKSLRAELERKKIQLAQMKEERERRSRINQGINDENLNPKSADLSLISSKTDDADAVLQALGLSVPLSRASTVPSNVSALDSSQRLTNVTSPENSQQNLLSPCQNQLQDRLSGSLGEVTSSQNASLAPIYKEMAEIGVQISPKETVYYSKSTQTIDPTPPPLPSESVDDDQSVPQGESVQQKSYYGKQFELAWDDEFPVLTYQDEDEEQSSDFNMVGDRQNKSTSTGGPGGIASSPAHLNKQKSTNGIDDKFTKSTDGQLTDKDVIEFKVLTEDERKQIEMREDYQIFIDKATKILERAIHNESSDIFIHYFPDDSKDAIDSDQKRGNKLSLDRIFYDEKWSKNRCVTTFDWSAQYSELLLASYYSNEQAPSDPDGTLLVWNMKFKNTSPEYVFHCQSAIVSCCFAKLHPSLIVGGTYSGQIVLWDMRSNKKTPVQRSSLTTAGHTHPVYCAKVVGTQNAHNLISISTDGKLCSWSLDMLSAPQETMELNQQKQTRSVAVTCMSFHPDDYNNFLVGSEDGMVYSACRHGSNTGITSTYDSHQGFVTNVDFRPEPQPGYSHLFLTSSIDWTVKLWDTKETQPIHTFESNGDYVYDVKWSPNNPALFATADGDGRVDIWNLANDSELPTASTHIEPMATGESRVQPSLNKLIWTPSGNQVVVGDDVGRIHVYDIGDVGVTESPRRQEEKWKFGE